MFWELRQDFVVNLVHNLFLKSTLGLLNSVAIVSFTSCTLCVHRDTASNTMDNPPTLLIKSIMMRLRKEQNDEHSASLSLLPRQTIKNRHLYGPCSWAMAQFRGERSNHYCFSPAAPLPSQPFSHPWLEPIVVGAFFSLAFPYSGLPWGHLGQACLFAIRPAKMRHWRPFGSWKHLVRSGGVTHVQGPGRYRCQDFCCVSCSFLCGLLAPYFRLHVFPPELAEIGAFAEFFPCTSIFYRSAFCLMASA